MALKKLQRLQRDYELDLDDELIEKRQTGHNLRELRDYVNHRIATTAVTGTPISGDQVYRVITEDVTEQERRDIATRLTDYDIDLAKIERDFISHEGVRTYLKDELDAEPEQEKITTGDVRNTIQWSAKRHQNIIRNQLERLAAEEQQFSLGAGVRIEIDVDIVCEGTNTIYGLTEFLHSDGCDHP